MINPLNLIRTVSLSAITNTTGDKTAGTAMIAEKNSPFNLEKGKMYGYEGANVQIKGDTMQIVYNSVGHSGVVHDYDSNSGWNGKPIDISKYSKLVIVVKKVQGDLSNTKFELNDQVSFDFGQIKEGENVIDLDAMKKDDFDPMKTINKINFVNKPGSGKYQVKLYLQ